MAKPEKPIGADDLKDRDNTGDDAIDRAASNSIPAPSVTKPEVRNFEKVVDVLHDLYVLEAAFNLRNESHDKTKYVPVQYLHQHSFHTVNSDGIPQTHSVSIGGHAHKVVVAVKDDKMTATVYPSRVWIAKVTAFPIDDATGQRKLPPGCETSGDDVMHVHTHPATYIRSEKLTVARR